MRLNVTYPNWSRFGPGTGVSRSSIGRHGNPPICRVSVVVCSIVRLSFPPSCTLCALSVQCVTCIVLCMAWLWLCDPRHYYTTLRLTCRRRKEGTTRAPLPTDCLCYAVSHPGPVCGVCAPHHLSIVTTSIRSTLHQQPRRSLPDAQQHAHTHTRTLISVRAHTQ